MRVFSKSQVIDELREEISELRKDVDSLKYAANIYVYPPNPLCIPHYRTLLKIPASEAIRLLAEKVGVRFELQEATPQRPILVSTKEKAK